MSNKLKVFVLIALALSFAKGAFAQDQSASSQPCTLKRLASLDMTVTPTGSISVPVGIAGNTYNLIVELSGFSSLTASVADKLNLTHEKSLDQFHGLPTTYVADVPDFRIGAIHSSNIQMSVVDHYLLPGSEGANGIIGADLLQKFGVEFDFASGKLNLYEPSTCGISTVFWSHDAVAAPFELNDLGGVLLHMQLDGKDVSVIPNFATGDATLSSYVAETTLNVKEGVPGFEPIPSDKGKLYRYPFKTLSMGGLTINNPKIVIYEDDIGERCKQKRRGIPTCFGFADMRITLSQLRALHLFFSFDEKMVYATGATAHL